MKADQWPKLGLQVDDVSSTKSAPFKRVVNVGSFAPESTVLKKMRASSLSKTGPVCDKQNAILHMLVFHSPQFTGLRVSN